MPLLLLAMTAAMTIAAPGGDVPRSPVASGAPPAVLSAPTRHVRSLNARVTDAIARGLRRSATFARLVAALDSSDVIAYVELSHDLAPSTDGRLTMLANGQVQRYVRIQVRALLSPDEIVAIIGHELQHAVEIADARWVVDEPTMRKYYARAGAGRSTSVGFETEAAQDAGRRVRRELRKHA